MTERKEERRKEERRTGGEIKTDGFAVYAGAGRFEYGSNHRKADRRAALPAAFPKCEHGADPVMGVECEYDQGEVERAAPASGTEPKQWALNPCRICGLHHDECCDNPCACAASNAYRSKEGMEAVARGEKWLASVPPDTPAAPPSVNFESQFEVFASRMGVDLTVDDEGYYKRDAQDLWDCWQAALAAAASDQMGEFYWRQRALSSEIAEQRLRSAAAPSPPSEERERLEDIGDEARWILAVGDSMCERVPEAAPEWRGIRDRVNTIIARASVPAAPEEKP